MNISAPILILPSTREFDSRPESEDTGSWYRHIYPMGTLFRASIVIIVGPTHFCCIKNRWGTTCARDRIPNHMLKSYLLQYSKHLTKESLIDALTEQHRDRWSESRRTSMTYCRHSNDDEPLADAHRTVAAVDVAQ